MRSASVIDLFCGVGGMTHGFVQEGFNVIAGIDIDLACKYAYERNNRARFLNWDVALTTPEQIFSLYPAKGIKILVGCAPCQPYSKYTNPKPVGGEWRLILAFGEFVRRAKPEIVSMENVPELKKHPVYDEFVRILESEGYKVSSQIVNCVDYGVPQTRRRLVLLASRLGAINLIRKTHSQKNRRTVEDAIRKLRPIEAGGIDPIDALHRASGLSDLNLARIRNTPSGGSWRDWPEELVLECHKRETGKTYGSVYGRMLWNAPSPTITTECFGLGNGRFGHPDQDRAISLREAALLQTFPPNYDFINPEAEFSFKAIGKLIGNAVPVRLGRIIARSIRKHLEAHNG